MFTHVIVSRCFCSTVMTLLAGKPEMFQIVQEKLNIETQADIMLLVW